MQISAGPDMSINANYITNSLKTDNKKLGAEIYVSII